MRDAHAAPRELDEEIGNVRQLIDCRVALKLGDIRGMVREIDDCVVAFLVVGRRRWEGLQVAIRHTGTPQMIDLSMPVPDEIKAQIAAMFSGGHTHTESIELGLITKVWIGRPQELGDPVRVALLECNGAHPYAHFPGEVCPIHFGDEPDQPSVAGFDWAGADGDDPTGG